MSILGLRVDHIRTSREAPSLAERNNRQHLYVLRTQLTVANIKSQLKRIKTNRKATERNKAY
ncbi:MAG: hypothetical protein QM606_03990, partial [Leucobacter sp.]